MIGRLRTQAIRRLPEFMFMVIEYILTEYSSNLSKV